MQLQHLLVSAADEITIDAEHLLHHRVLRLTAAQARALHEHLDALVEGLRPAGAREGEYGVLVGLYRRT